MDHSRFHKCGCVLCLLIAVAVVVFVSVELELCFFGCDKKEKKADWPNLVAVGEIRMASKDLFALLESRRKNTTKLYEMKLTIHQLVNLNPKSDNDALYVRLEELEKLLRTVNDSLEYVLPTAVFLKPKKVMDEEVSHHDGSDGEPGEDTNKSFLRVRPDGRNFFDTEHPQLRESESKSRKKYVKSSRPKTYLKERSVLSSPYEKVDYRLQGEFEELLYTAYWTLSGCCEKPLKKLTEVVQSVSSFDSSLKAELECMAPNLPAYVISLEQNESNPDNPPVKKVICFPLCEKYIYRIPSIKTLAVKILARYLKLKWQQLTGCHSETGTENDPHISETDSSTDMPLPDYLSNKIIGFRNLTQFQTLCVDYEFYETYLSSSAVNNSMIFAEQPQCLEPDEKSLGGDAEKVYVAKTYLKKHSVLSGLYEKLDIPQKEEFDNLVYSSYRALHGCCEKPFKKLFETAQSLLESESSLKTEILGMTSNFLGFVFYQKRNESNPDDPPVRKVMCFPVCEEYINGIPTIGTLADKIIVRHLKIKWHQLTGSHPETDMENDSHMNETEFSTEIPLSVYLGNENKGFENLTEFQILCVDHHFYETYFPSPLSISAILKQHLMFLAYAESKNLGKDSEKMSLAQTYLKGHSVLSRLSEKLDVRQKEEFEQLVKAAYWSVHSSCKDVSEKLIKLLNLAYSYKSPFKVVQEKTASGLPGFVLYKNPKKLNTDSPTEKKLICFPLCEDYIAEIPNIGALVDAIVVSHLTLKWHELTGRHPETDVELYSVGNQTVRFAEIPLPENLPRHLKAIRNLTEIKCLCVDYKFYGKHFSSEHAKNSAYSGDQVIGIKVVPLSRKVVTETEKLMSHKGEAEKVPVIDPSELEAIPFFSSQKTFGSDDVSMTTNKIGSVPFESSRQKKSLLMKKPTLTEVFRIRNSRVERESDSEEEFPSKTDLKFLEMFLDLDALAIQFGLAERAVRIAKLVYDKIEVTEP